MGEIFAHLVELVLTVVAALIRLVAKVIRATWRPGRNDVATRAIVLGLATLLVVGGISGAVWINKRMHPPTAAAGKASLGAIVEEYDRLIEEAKRREAGRQ